MRHPVEPFAGQRGVGLVGDRGEPTLHDSDTSSAERVSGSPGSRPAVPLMWVYSSRNPVPAVHFQG